jgi:Uma2 family endonuclease
VRSQPLDATTALPYLVSSTGNLGEPEYIDNGAKLGWLLNRKDRQVEIYRPDRDVEILQSPTSLSGEAVLPGFVLELGSIWQ